MNGLTICLPKVFTGTEDDQSEALLFQRPQGSVHEIGNIIRMRNRNDFFHRQDEYSIIFLL